MKIDRSFSLRSIQGIFCIALFVVGCSHSVEDRLEEVRELQASNRSEEAIPILIELIESGERRGEILYRYGRALSLTGKAERSVWALDAAREDPEWFVRASQQLAVDAQMGGNYDFALDVFARLHEEAPEAIENDPFAMLLETRILLDTQTRFEEALELAESVIERFPEEESAIRMKAVALLGLKRSDEAYEVLRAAEIGPEEPTPKEKTADAEEVVADAQGESSEEEDPGIYLDVEDDSREAYWCTVRVSFKREAGEIEEATKIADECLERFASAPDLITEAINLYSTEGRFDRVEEILQVAYSESPENREVRRAYTQFLERIGEFKKVEKVLRDAIAESEKAGRGQTGEAASIWVDLAGFLMEHDRDGEALLAFDKVNTIVGDNASPDLLLRQAEALLRTGEYDEALAMAEKSPAEVHRQMLRGRVAFERGEYARALELLGQAAVLWPDNAPIRYYRARAAEGLGDFDSAIEDYRHAIRSDPKLAAARERLARLHLAEGNFREAASIISFQSPRTPSEPSTAMRILMVEVEARRGSEPDLQIPGDRTHSNHRVRVETVRALGRGLFWRVGPRAAEGVLAEFEKQSIAPVRGAFLRERVELMALTDNVDRAIKETRAGLKARPDDFDTQLALARALLLEGESLDEIEKLLGAVLEKMPGDADALTMRGDLAVRRGDLNGAIAEYERALTASAEHWPALSRLVEQLVGIGRRNQAIERLETFLDRDQPYVGEAALTLARLLPDVDESKSRRVELARRAIRFGAGEDGLPFLASIDPTAAAEYEVIDEAKVEKTPEDAAEAEAEAEDDSNPDPARS